MAHFLLFFTHLKKKHCLLSDIRCNPEPGTWNLQPGICNLESATCNLSTSYSRSLRKKEPHNPSSRVRKRVPACLGPTHIRAGAGTIVSSLGQIISYIAFITEQTCPIQEEREIHTAPKSICYPLFLTIQGVWHTNHPPRRLHLTTGS